MAEAKVEAEKKAWIFGISSSSAIWAGADIIRVHPEADLEAEVLEAVALAEASVVEALVEVVLPEAGNQITGQDLTFLYFFRIKTVIGTPV